ncbi:MAG: gamma-glutamyltransferase, partial [Woeseiaceae bacterium]|nr:gamma-glutamyltransferase [Woeseiaceae bacterium]
HIGAGDADDDNRKLALLDALRVGHTSRRNEPITNYRDYDAGVRRMTSKAEALSRLEKLQDTAGETTHFSVVDGDGMAVSVTQSIDSYFGAKVMHPTLGFLYNNYMQGFQVDDPAAPYYLAESEMPLSSMSATIVSENGVPQLVLGSPGSARIISAVAQVASHWIDVAQGVEAAVAAWRVHVVPDDRAYVEGPELSAGLLRGIGDRGLRLVRPTYGVSDSHYDPYFGGVHAVASEQGTWTGAADPRRDGKVGTAFSRDVATGSSSYTFSGWAGPPVNVRLYTPQDAGPDTPVVIVMHGWSRDAPRYFTDWERVAREQRFIVAVPHFPVGDFRGANEYNLGHVFDRESGERRPPEQWTFAAIEALFDDVVSRTGSRQERYTLYGHSAGGQFVHRFLYYMPGARVKRFIAANAGWYTMPEFGTPYPYGLGDAAVSEADLMEALGKDVVLLLGREDTDYDDPNLRKTPEAVRQGPNRFVRGHSMYEAAREAAERLDTDLRWRIVVVDNAGHNNAAMTPAAAQLVE